jgi:hypothetical protein
MYKSLTSGWLLPKTIYYRIDSMKEKCYNTTMINFNLTISNPFSDQFDPGKVRHGRFGKTKAWELQSMRTNSILEIGFRLSFRCDHAGAGIELGLLGRTVTVTVYDVRHWNYETKSWSSND